MQEKAGVSRFFDLKRNHQPSRWGRKALAMQEKSILL